MGLILCLVGIMILALPLGLFVLGGGGNTGRFLHEIVGILTTGLVVIIAGSVLLVIDSLSHSRTLKRARDGRGPGA